MLPKSMCGFVPEAPASLPRSVQSFRLETAPLYFTEISSKVKENPFGHFSGFFPVSGFAGAHPGAPAERNAVYPTTLFRQTLTPAAAMANTNQKMHMTRG